MIKTLLAGLAVGAILFGAPDGAGATIIQTDVGLSSPATTIHFDEFGLASLTSVTNQYASMGATFSPNLVQSPQGGGWPNIDNNNLGNSNGGPTGITPFYINFENDQSSVAFAYVTNDGSSIFTIYKDGTKIEDAAFTQNIDHPEYNWYVFSGIAFDSIMIDVGGSASEMLLDNLQLGANNSVPEPATMLLLGTGLAGLLGIARRKKKKD